MIQFYSPQEAAVMLRLSYITVLEHIKAGRIQASKPSGKHIYITGQALEDYMSGAAQGATGETPDMSRGIYDGAAPVEDLDDF